MVRPGYKQTEVGVIPDDWGVMPLGEMAKLERGKFSARPRNDPRYFGGNIPFIQTGDITNSNGKKASYSQTLNDDGLKVSRIFPENTLFFTIAANIGDVAIVPFKAACPDSLISIEPKPSIYKEWLYQALRLKKADFERIATSNAQLNINLEKLNPYLMAVPSVRKEQELIAEALSDVDELIVSLENLIAKKRDIKTATMQKLLTGKKRLPGFSEGKGTKQTELGEIPEDWDIVPLIEAVDFLDGKRKPVKMSDRAKMRGIYPYYGASGIVDYVNDYLFDDDLILLGEDGENILSRAVPLAFKISGKTWVNNHAHVLKPKADFDIGYLCDFLESLDYALLNSGTAQPKLNKQTCKKIRISKPDTDEQKAIAKILSDINLDIFTLETKLNKTKSIKQGMMQELLTGRTRLVAPQAASYVEEERLHGT